MTFPFRSGATGWPSQVDSVEVILTESEKEAQLLEKELIDEYRPPYNVSTIPMAVVCGSK